MEQGQRVVCPPFCVSPLKLAGEWLWEAPGGVAMAETHTDLSLGFIVLALLAPNKVCILGQMPD